jgi:hypothetical protein
MLPRNAEAEPVEVEEGDGLEGAELPPPHPGKPRDPRTMNGARR